MITTLSNWRGFRRSSAGFSIVELVVLMAVIGILMAIGFPMYLSYSRTEETEGAARTIVTTLNQARQVAIMRGVSYTVQTQTHPNNRMMFFCAATTTTCAAGTVWTDAGSDAAGWRKLDNAARITVGPSITFNALGAATASGAFRVQNSSATDTLDVCVSPSGRIRLTAMGAACP